MAEKGLNCGINKTLNMATKITVPDIGDFENVEIIEILTKPGAIIKKNDPIVTLESDKSSVEVPSPFSGKISFRLFLSCAFKNSFSFVQTCIAAMKDLPPLGAAPRYVSKRRSKVSKGFS